MILGYRCPHVLCDCIDLFDTKLDLKAHLMEFHLDAYCHVPHLEASLERLQGVEDDEHPDATPYSGLRCPECHSAGVRPYTLLPTRDGLLQHLQDHHGLHGKDLYLTGDMAPWIDYANGPYSDDDE
jgi:hypothetical protein